jgi:hypothetical protein
MGTLHLTRLTCLRLVMFTYDEGFQLMMLSVLTTLKSLNLDGLGCMCDVAPLMELTSLTFLGLLGCTNLQSRQLHALGAAMPDLQRLDVSSSCLVGKTNAWKTLSRVSMQLGLHAGPAIVATCGTV